MIVQRINLPITQKDILKLKVGDCVLLTGTLLTLRDASHKKMIEDMVRKGRLSFKLKGQTIYYMGPTPARPGRVIGSAGPTTSGRMDNYTPILLEKGLKCMIGKGKRSQAVKEAMKRHEAIYLAAVGGAGALISKAIKKARAIAYRELGAEAVFQLYVEDFPAVVVNDIYGGDLYEQGKNRYREK